MNNVECSTNIKGALIITVQYSARSGAPGDLDPPLPKVPRPQKFPARSVYCIYELLQIV